MLSARSKMEVKEEFKKLNLHYVFVEMGEVEIMETLNSEQLEELKQALHRIGLELMDDKKAVLIDKIKNAIIDIVHFSEENIKVNFSQHLSEKLNHNYTYMANLFSQIQGTTIEQFMISHKVERIKELIIYDEMNISEIAWKMNYSSVAHLSNQFKKITGLTPTQFRQLKNRTRIPIEEVGSKRSK